MKDLIKYLVTQLADEDSFDILTEEEEDRIEYKVLVDQEYIARVIGRGGRTSRAIRTLVRAANNDRDKSVSVYIAER